MIIHKIQIDNEFNIAKCIDLYKQLDKKQKDLEAAKKGEIVDEIIKPTLLEDDIAKE